MAKKAAKVKSADKPVIGEEKKVEEVKAETKVEKTKKQKPSLDGAKEPKPVEKKVKRDKVNPPPIAIPFIGDIMNPLLVNGRGKHGMCVALARCTDNDDVLIEAVRVSGVCQRAGISIDNLETGNITKSDHSGRGYALRCGRKYQKDYPDEKVTPFMEFAKALIEVVEKKKYDDAVAKAQQKLEEVKKNPPVIEKPAKPEKKTVLKKEKVEEPAATPKVKKVKREKPALA